ncbi:cohesin domain-containing protein [Granulicella arctica]|uniref:General secretion pathway protein D n=1 Tax=Granulicella arctica TaxID=940613 RepID=A0A7Y9TUD1_9BACT|nr:cohesin domain-containing protein [Granulicella arctica]NYF80833.1 general secretion pathway protein D [Granulicella arctica]
MTTIAAHAQSAKAWDKRGQKAEAREDYDEAYEDYGKARAKAPKDLRYKTRLERIRFQAAAMHVDRGRVLRQSGDLTGAMTEFSRAIMIDPSDQAAEQEMAIAQQQLNALGAPKATAEPEQKPSDSQSELRSLSGVTYLKPMSDTLVTLHMVEDTKVIYQAIGKAVGINVLFDPDYTSKRIPIDLTNMTYSDALRVVGTLAGTFYKTVTPNTIFVAQNTRTKRTDLDEVAVQTFYLTNASQAADATEILTAIRNLLDTGVKVYLVPSQNAIVMRATPDQLMLAQKLLNDLDRAKPEVVVDVAVLEVNRDKIRNLGITLPQSIELTPQVATTTSSSSSSSTTTTASLTLNNLAHLNANNFGVTIGGGTLTALLSDSDTRVLQNPKIRATDGQKASLKIGSRIPIATGSYSAGVSTGVSSVGVQTQFTYIDVGVNIEMTPTVHYDHEVTLKMKIEVSSETGQTTISDVTEPIISQRTIDQTIQLKEGEPSILAGLLDLEDTRSNSGTPGLAELPLLKYVFGTQSKEVKRDEVVFVLIPHIVRESVLTRLNTRAIDTGTGSSVELRRDADLHSDAYVEPNPYKPSTSDTTAANAASSMVQLMQQQAQRPGPGEIAPGVPLPSTASSVAAGPPVNLSVVPPNGTQAVGTTFQTSVMLNNGRDVYSVPLQLQFDPKVLELVNVDAGEFLGKDGQAVSLVHRDEGNGLVTISTSRPPGVAGMSGQGNLCTLTFKAKAAGDSTLALVRVGAKNSAQANLPAVGSQAVVHVK